LGYVTGEAKELPLRPAFDRRIKLEFHGARITSDGGLLAYRELDGALELTDMAITKLLDGRRTHGEHDGCCGTGIRGIPVESSRQPGTRPTVSRLPVDPRIG
jgi:hypothetical protein